MILVQNRVRTCSIRNCKEPYSAKGFCRHHYNQSPERKASRSTPEFKAKQKKYESSSRRKELNKAYELTPKAKATRKKYNNSDKRKAKRKEPEVIAKAKVWQIKYDSDPKNKSRKKEYAHSSITLARRKTIRDEIRLEVLQYYSKRLSKSNIPCCRCCGEKSHVDFLAIDHIAGRKEMDSDTKLVKIGYSSSKRGQVLHKWVTENNFPKGFQILCHNCNYAKGIKRNKNKCPHQLDKISRRQ